jgi:hypothetical protein
MDFEKAVGLIGTVTDLRRIASAHVIDHNQLKDDELRTALVEQNVLDRSNELDLEQLACGYKGIAGGFANLEPLPVHVWRQQMCPRSQVLASSLSAWRFA